jgi:hypothetical protein
MKSADSHSIHSARPPRPSQWNPLRASPSRPHPPSPNQQKILPTFGPVSSRRVAVATGLRLRSSGSKRSEPQISPPANPAVCNLEPPPPTSLFIAAAQEATPPSRRPDPPRSPWRSHGGISQVSNAPALEDPRKVPGGDAVPSWLCEFNRYKKKCSKTNHSPLRDRPTLSRNRPKKPNHRASHLAPPNPKRSHIGIAIPYSAQKPQPPQLKLMLPCTASPLTTLPRLDVSSINESDYQMDP